MSSRDDEDDLSDLIDLSDDDALGTEGLDAATLDHRRVRRFTLRVVAGPDEGAVFGGAGEPVIVGTHESAQARLSDRTVSRFHCQLEVDEGRALVRDLGSRNGTRVDGVRVLAAHLRSGAVVSVGKTQLRFELGADLVAVPLSERTRFGLAVGRSPAMRAIFAALERVASSDVTVLVTGETGTGKDVVAESIHRESARRDGPFVVVDCGAMPANLIESELFGHERGAFTGADRARAGAFEIASGGTLFLDEIGELDLELQPKLLRALERREVQRLGGAARVPVDVRVIAATSRPLRRMVNEKLFRPDLFYRLAVVEIALPPLRDRREDLPLIVDHLLDEMGARRHPASEHVRSEAFQARLLRHPWPGNVRELKNAIAQALALGGAAPAFEDAAAAGGLPAIDPDQPIRVARERWVRHFERRYLEELLRRHGGNVSAAARAAGVDRMHLYRLMWRAGLR